MEVMSVAFNLSLDSLIRVIWFCIIFLTFCKFIKSVFILVKFCRPGFYMNGLICLGRWVVRCVCWGPPSWCSTPPRNRKWRASRTCWRKSGTPVKQLSGLPGIRSLAVLSNVLFYSRQSAMLHDEPSVA